MPEPLHHTIVCFDLGGVIVRICRTWAEACHYAGLDVRSPERLTSDPWLKRRRTVVDDYQRGSLTCETYFQALSVTLDGLYNTAEVEQIHTAWTREQYAGVEALIDGLNALPNVSTACLSNTNHAHWQRLSGADGADEYPAVRKIARRLASHVMGSVKPDASIYARAHAELTHDRGPNPRVVFFDDLADNVAAAQRQGWDSLQIDPSGDTCAQMRGHLHERHGLLP